MNAFDLGVLVLAGILMAAGLWRGAVRQLAGLAGVVAGAGVALRYHAELAGRIPWGAPALREVAAFGALFLATLALAAALGWAVSRILGAACLGWTDRALGAGLGLLKAALVTAAVAYFLSAALPPRSALLRGSVLLPHALRAAEVILDVLPRAYRQPVQEGRRAVRELARGV